MPATISVREQKEKIVEFVEKRANRIPLIYIRQWVPAKDIIEYMSQYRMGDRTIRLRLQELVRKRILQEKVIGGRVFYAPPVIPPPLLVAGLVTAFLLFFFTPVTGYVISPKTLPFLLSPFLAGIIITLVEKRIRNAGICLDCGKVVYNGELYCERCAENNIVVERYCQLCGKPFKAKIKDRKFYCDKCMPVVEKIRK